MTFQRLMELDRQHERAMDAFDQFPYGSEERNDAVRMLADVRNEQAELKASLRRRYAEAFPDVSLASLWERLG